nr:hypothetical protein [Phycisphaerae bacterium]
GQKDEKTLPEGGMDNLSLFRSVLQTVTQKAAQEAKASGSTALPSGMPAPETMSGGTFAGILNTVGTQKTQGIKDIYKSTIDLLDEQEQRANNQLDTLISTGAIVNLDDATLQKLADSTHNSVEYLKEIRTIKQKKEKQTDENTELSAEDVGTYTDMVLTGQLDLTSVPSGKGMRAEVGRQIAQVYQNPIANKIEVWKGKKEQFLSEGKESGYTDPGTREDLVREIKMAYPEYETDEIKQVVYALIPDVWEYNIQKRWRNKSTGLEGIQFEEGEGE